MKCLRILLVFLVLIGSIVIAKQPKQVVKNIGKRFNVDRQLGLMVKWKLTPEEERRKLRDTNTGYIGGIIQTQSSNRNWNWERGEWAFEKLMSPDFKGSLCSGTKLNYVQFIDHWKRKREQQEKNDEGQLYIAFVKPDDLDVTNKFMVSFVQKSDWGYKYNATYVVHASIKKTKDEDDINIYVIDGVDDVSDCSEYGNVDWRAQNGTNTLRVEVDDPEERQKVDEYLKKMFAVGEKIDVVLFDWIPKVMAKYEFFSAHICHDGLLKRYTKMKLIKWWRKFQVLWHPEANSTNHTDIQLLGGTRGRYVYKVNMYLRLGPNPNATLQKVEMKLQIKYNVHGDQLWYTVRSKIIGPPWILIVPDFARKVQKMMDNPEMWYACTDVFYDLISKDKVEFESCAGLGGEKMEKIDMLNQLEHKFWEKNKDKNGRLEGYAFGGEFEMSKEVGESMFLAIFAIWTPPAEGMVHESRWTFYFRWSKDLQMYEIVKISFACPTTEKGSRIYRPLQFG